MNYQLFLIKTFLKILQTISPKAAARFVYRMASKPRTFILRDIEKEALSVAINSSYKFRGKDIKIYQWPEQGKKVLLVHGWEGHAGNFGQMALHLQGKGYDVTAYDAPAHGHNTDKKADWFDFVYLVGELLQQQKYDYIISHSFGSVATVLSLSLLHQQALEKLVMVTVPNLFSDRVNQLGDMIGMNEKTRRAFFEHVKDISGIDEKLMDVQHAARQTKIKEALIIHDKNDKVMPVEWSRSLDQNWDKTRMVELEGTGHYRILWDQQTFDLIDQFFESDKKEERPERKNRRLQRKWSLADA